MKNEEFIKIDLDLIGDSDLKGKIVWAKAPKRLLKEAKEMEQTLIEDGWYKRGGPRYKENVKLNIMGNIYELARWTYGNLLVKFKNKKGIFKVKEFSIEKIK